MVWSESYKEKQRAKTEKPARGIGIGKKRAFLEYYGCSNSNGTAGAINRKPLLEEIDNFHLIDWNNVARHIQ